jgi:drug/metabolite transporter (DMT)-like permease
MIETIENIGWSIVFSVIGGLLGMVLVLMASVVVPRLIDRLTPNIDEQKEIVRGNGAVAEYYGRLVAAAILGVSIVVGAAVLGGVMAALH